MPEHLLGSIQTMEGGDPEGKVERVGKGIAIRRIPDGPAVDPSDPDRQNTFKMANWTL
jgi:hypothetical protein